MEIKEQSQTKPAVKDYTQEKHLQKLSVFAAALMFAPQSFTSTFKKVFLS